MRLNDYTPFYKRNLQIAVPVMLSQAGQVLVQQADNIMVGAVGTTELAAASFAGSVFIIGMMFAMGFTFGLTPLVAHAWAKGNHREAGSLLRNGLASHFSVGIILTLIMGLVYYILGYMGQTEQVLELAKPYYLIQVASLIPFVLFFSFKQFAEGLGNTTVAMVITLTVNVINIGLNYIFIFGHYGMPEMGLNGAGYATLIARCLMPLLMMVYFIYKPQFRRYIIFARNSILNIQQIRRLISVGFPIGSQMVMEVTAFAMSCVMAGWFNEVTLAAHQIALGLSSISFMIVTGIASGTTIRVAHQYSSGDYRSMRMAAMASVHLVLMFMCFTALIFYLFRHQLPEFYSSDPAVMTIAAQLLIMAAIYQIFDGMQVVMLGVLRGLADVKYAMKCAFVAYFIVNIPISYLFAFVLGVGPMGIWIGFVAGLGLAAVLFLIRFNRQSRQLIAQQEAILKAAA